MNFVDKYFWNNDYEKLVSRLSFVRILIGLIIAIRFTQLTNSYFILESNIRIIVSSIVVISSLFFSLGFLTKLNAFFLFLSLSYCSFKLESGTLADVIAQTALIPYLFIGGNQRYSADNLLIKFNTKWSKYLCVNINKFTMVRAYILTFTAYGIMSLFALFYHLQDDFWIKGQTLQLLLLDPYLSKYFPLFEYIFISKPALLRIISYVAFIGQSIFQVFMIPLVLTKWGRFFVKYWGMSFFLSSLFFINLSYLPHMEILLWLILFPGSKNASLTIYYDEFCNLCKKSMNLMHRIDYDYSLRFVGIRESRGIDGVSSDDMQREIHAVYKSKVYRGYDVYLLFTRINLFYAIFFPIFFIGKVSGLGVLIYKFVASRRLETFGVCDLNPSSKYTPQSLIGHSGECPSASRLIIPLLLSLQICYVAGNTALLVKSDSLVAVVYSKIRPYVRLMGLDLPIVFNETDLLMADIYVVLERKTNGNFVKVKYIGHEGERLMYHGGDIMHFSNHGSDYLYYGNTLPLHRYLIGQSGEFKKNERVMYYLNRLAVYDKLYNKHEKDVIYRASFYNSERTKLSVLKNGTSLSQNNPNNLIEVFEFKIDEK